MRILFVNPPYTHLEGMEESAGHMMPLSFGYLAAYARKHMDGLTFEIVDAEAAGLSIEETGQRIRAFCPDIVGVTSPTPAVDHSFEIARITKEINRDTRVVFGGVHPTVLPEQTLEACSAVDFLVIGEGEETFRCLLEAMRFGQKDVEGIQGLCLRRKGRAHRTPERDLIRDLDSIPFPARDLYDLSLYRSAPTKKVSEENATPILTSRGCPHNCIHCPSKTIWRGVLRKRSAKNVLREISECSSRFDLREFNFFDDTFTVDKRRVRAICKGIIESKTEIFWICFARADSLDDDLIREMKSAGCRKISLGLESGDQNILNIMRKKTSVEVGRRAVEKIRKHGLPVHASFILGNVGETEESIRRTVDFATSLDLDNATFFIATPFPGTDLFEIGKKLGTITADTAWEKFAPLTNAAPILVQGNVSAERLVYWQKEAFRRFYLRPKYILRKAKLVLSADGVKTLLEGVRVLFRILRKGEVGMG